MSKEIGNVFPKKNGDFSKELNKETEAVSKGSHRNFWNGKEKPVRPARKKVRFWWKKARKSHVFFNMAAISIWK